MVRLILTVPKAPKSYVYNGLGEFDTSKAAKPYIYKGLGAFWIAQVTKPQ